MNRKTIYPIIVLIIAGIVYSISQNKEEGKEVTISNKIKNMELDPSIKKTTIAFYNVENLFDIYDDPHKILHLPGNNVGTWNDIMIN